MLLFFCLKGPPPAYQCYEAGTNGVDYGLWYHFGIDDGLIANITSIISNYQERNPDTFTVTFLHCGPNFQWLFESIFLKKKSYFLYRRQPYASHVKLLQSIATVSNLVWGTSSHHIQRFEVFENTPIIYGLGDLLFRHVPGVDDFCPLYAIPCEQVGRCFKFLKDLISFIFIYFLFSSGQILLSLIIFK